MTTGTVTNTVVLPDGTTPTNLTVRIQLIGSTGTPLTSAYITATGAEIDGVTELTSTNGTWSAVLQLNSGTNLTPSNTQYQVTQTVYNAAGHSLTYVDYISVTGSGTMASMLTPGAPASLTPAGAQTYTDTQIAALKSQTLLFVSGLVANSSAAATANTTVVSSAITALGAGGGEILIPPGNFYINPNVITVTTDGVRVRGMGRKASTLTLTSDGAAFTVNANNFTITDIGAAAPTDASVLVNIGVTGKDDLTIERCLVNGTRLFISFVPASYAAASSTGDTTNVTIKNNRCIGPNTRVTASAAVELRYVFGGEITGNQVSNYAHGMMWWGGDANADGAITNTRKAGDLSFVANRVSNVDMGGIWGSMGTNVTVNANPKISACGDVGIDNEGGLSVSIAGNTVYNCTNACITTFFLSRAVSISNNSLTQNADGRALIWIHNSTQSPDNKDVTITGNSLTCLGGGIGVVTAETVEDVTVVGNMFRNVRLNVRANNSKNQIVVDNTIEIDVVAGAAFTAVDMGQTNNIGRMKIANNLIRSDATQPAGTRALYVLQSDFNSPSATEIDNNDFNGFPKDLEVEQQTNNAGQKARFYVRNNVFGANSFTRTETGSSPMICFLEGNRSSDGNPFPSAVPTTQRWDQGQIIMNPAPAASGTVGWVCVAAGAPGTWKTYGAIAA